MKVAANFTIQEFVPKAIWDQFGEASVWFINPKVIHLAQFYKEFFKKYYVNKYGAKVHSVSIVVNTWSYIKGGMQYRGYRPFTYKKGATLSQHRQGNAFDCDINIKFKDGTRTECDYVEIHKVIQANAELFQKHGLSAVEDVSIAKTWLHSDCRWIVQQKGIMVVKPRKR